MGGTKHITPTVSLLALSLALAATSLPAAAQSGSEAVVCVGSERRTLATNPIRRVYTEDMEIVYRIGADIGQRDQVERDLSSDLGSYPEVWCAWSDPWDDHAVIISYTGVIRQDLTVDPEDPRFQAFSVGDHNRSCNMGTQAPSCCAWAPAILVPRNPGEDCGPRLAYRTLARRGLYVPGVLSGTLADTNIVRECSSVMQRVRVLPMASREQVKGAHLHRGHHVK